MNTLSSTVSAPRGAMNRDQNFIAARTDNRELREELDALHRNYAASLPLKIAQLEALWQQIRCDEVSGDDCSDDASSDNFSSANISDETAAPDDALPTFYRLVHNLAGSGALYGFDEIGQTARAMTVFLKPWSAPDASSTAQPPLKRELCEHIETLLGALKAAL